MGTIRAAQYLRMSTEHQRYSPEHQAAAIAVYAATRGYEVVRTYRDDGISGLGIRNRAGLKALLADVLAGEPGYRTVLVYDVSRWGRFQNPDQSAHYEFLCAEAGVGVEYCAEPFDNDGSTASTIIKAVKRVMAAEYSRDLSQKVSQAQRRMAAMGYWQGGPPGYGFRRMAIDADGRPGLVLEAGEFKGVQGHRTILIMGPPEEVRIVRWIYRTFANGGMSQLEIARRLNAAHETAEAGAAWTYDRVHKILRNPKYMGEIATRKTSGDAFTSRRNQPRADWIMVKDACPALVDRKVYNAAQKRFETQYRRKSPSELLSLLRRLHAENGRVTSRLMRETPWMPDPSLYQYRFGSMGRAYLAAGLPYREQSRLRRRWPDREKAMRLLAELFQREGYLTSKLIAASPELPHPSTYRQICGNLRNAYARVGYLPMSRAGRSSPVGEARRLAARSRMRAPLGGGGAASE